MKQKHLSLVGFGNPVIDININENTSLLINKYNLNEDTQNGLPPEIYKDMQEEVKRDTYKKIYKPGGCVQNSVRLFQWLENRPLKTLMYGTIGEDEHGRYLIEQLYREGVTTRFDITTEKPTTSAILLSNKQYRTIVYTLDNVDAGFNFSKAPTSYLEVALESLSYCKILLLDGYFSLHSAHYVTKLLEKCRSNDTLIAFSGGGESIIKDNSAKQTYLPFLLQSHIISLNLREFQAACKLVDVNPSNLESALQAFCQLSNNLVKSSLCKYSRIIVVTDGENPLYCYTNEDKLRTFAAPAIPLDEIKDTTGAGDAFMAGFLYGICYQKSISQSIQIGCQTAAEIIRRVGCEVPDTPPTFVTYE